MFHCHVVCNCSVIFPFFLVLDYCCGESEGRRNETSKLHKFGDGSHTNNAKSVCNRCVIKLFGDVFVLLLFCGCSIRIGICIMLLCLISSFFSVYQNIPFKT